MGAFDHREPSIEVDKPCPEILERYDLLGKYTKQSDMCYNRSGRTGAMSLQVDYAILDQPEILQFIFYPRKDFTNCPANATDLFIPVDNNISIACRFYVKDQSSSSLLFFHDNGEVVSDYDFVAPLFTGLGINLFVADYRGYGSSGGSPTFASMVRDAHIVFKAFAAMLRQGQYTDNLFVMGRSLGSIPAIEVASHYQEQIKGLIIESGLANVARLLGYVGFPGWRDMEFPNLVGLRAISLPTLIIHGECDSLIPATEARDLFQNVAAQNKRLVIIAGADHNDVMVKGLQQYFAAIKEFVLAARHPDQGLS